MFATNQECKKLDKKCYYPIKCAINPYSYFRNNTRWVIPTHLENRCFSEYESADIRYLGIASEYHNNDETKNGSKRCYFTDIKNGQSSIATPGQIVLAKCKNLKNNKDL